MTEVYHVILFLDRLERRQGLLFDSVHFQTPLYFNDGSRRPGSCIGAETTPTIYIDAYGVSIYIWSFLFPHHEGWDIKSVTIMSCKDSTSVHSAPLWSKPYKYTRLPSPNSIRLLKFLPHCDCLLHHRFICGTRLLRCSLDVVDLDDKPIYDALSYTWGNPTSDGTFSDAEYGLQNRMPIFCNNRLLFVTKNLHDALSQLSSEREQGLVEDREPTYNKTELHWAAENGKTDRVRSLLNSGADTSNVDIFGETPLHYAAENGHMEAVKLLVAAGADLSAVDNGGRTPLICAKQRLRNQHKEVCSLLEGLGSGATKSDAASSARLRSRSPRIWIDAVCINQEDLVERNAQVSLMGRIYSKAQQVIVWLGLPDKDTPSVLQCIEYMKSYPSDRPLPELKAAREQEFMTRAGLSRRPVKILVDFFRSRSWFVRIWILQETVLAKKIVVLCGSHVIAWQALMQATREINDIIVRAEAGDVYHSLTPKVLYQLAHPGLKDGERPLHTMLALTRGFLATDLRDKVYALLALTAEGQSSGASDIFRHGIIPDYGKPLGDVYLETTRAILRDRRCAMFLTIAGERHGGMRSCPHLPESLPSWVPDLACSVYTRGNFCVESCENNNDGSSPQLADCGNSEQRTDFIHATQSNRILGVSAARVSTIIEQSKASHMQEPVLRFDDSVVWDWMQLTNNLPSIYSTGEHRRDVLRHTISRKTLHSRPHISKDFDEKFHEVLLFGILRQAAFILQNKPLGDGEDASTQLSEAADLTNLAMLEEGSDTSPSESLIEKWEAFTAWHMQHCNGNYTDMGATLQRIEPYVKDITRRWGFKLGRTEDNYLCRCPNSTRCGDSIWIVDGADVPFVLRERGPGQFQLIGQVYVHGIMKAETLDVGKLKFEQIELV